MAARDLPSHPNIEQYKKEAEDLLERCTSRDPDALSRVREFGRPPAASLARARASAITPADARFVIAREHGFDGWPEFVKEIAARTAASLAPDWNSAEEAIVAGDVSRLARLLDEHAQMFRSQRAQSSWLGGLTPDYSGADARSIIVRNHLFESWDQFAA